MKRSTLKRTRTFKTVGQPKRTGLQRRATKHWRLALDRLCRQVVFARDRGRCVVRDCGKTAGVQWAHVESRRYLSTRWDTRFSMLLCPGHHYVFWHQQPVAAAKWWTEAFPDRARALEMVRSQKQKVDPELIRLRLELEAKQLGVEVP